MKNLLSAMLIAVYLLAGCSSNSGGTSGGSGGEGTTQAGSLLLSGSLSAGDSFSHDTFIHECFDAMGVSTGFEPGLVTKTGTFTVTISNISDLTGGLFPVGVILTSYTVDFIGASAGAPALSSRVFGQTISIVDGGSTVTATVILVDLASTLMEFQAATAGEPHSYQVRITWRGRTLSGDDVVLSASAFLELADFENCA